jgi:hypothetical protein
MLDKTSVFVCVVLGATLSIARADTEPEGDPGTAPLAASISSGDGNDQLTLPKGRLVLDAFIEIGLSDGSEFEPISVSPDVWYGVSDDLTVGLVHSGRGASGFIGSVGDSLCLSGEGGGCGDIYSNVGLNARYKLKTGPLSYAVDGGLYANSIDPLALAVKLGVVGRWQKAKLAVEFQPNVFIGVTERDGVVTGGVAVGGNKEILSIPVTAYYAVGPKVALSLQTGVVMPFEEIADTFTVPLSLGGHYSLNESMNLTLAFTFPAIIAGTEGGIDARSLTLGATYAF